MFFNFSTNYNDIGNDPVRKCFLGKVIKLYKRCNIAANKFVGYVRDSGDTYWDIVDKYTELKKPERVSWEIDEAPCMILWSDSIQIGICINNFETGGKRLKVNNIGLHDLVKDIEKYICRKQTCSYLSAPYYIWNHHIIKDENKIISPATMPYLNHKRSTKHNEYDWDIQLLKHHDLPMYCNLIAKINGLLANNHNLWGR